MKNNDALKKNHFWILLGLVPLLALIAVFMISSDVGGKIDERKVAIAKAKADIGKVTNPKSEATLTEADKLILEVSSKKGDLHKANWDRQKSMYVWPNNGKLKAVEKLGLKFGDKIPNYDFTYDAFKRPEVYLAEFSTAAVKEKANLPPDAIGMVEMIAPTQFNGGWQRTLRHVNAWGTQQITSEQIWLMMEDIWVQRSLLDAVRSVNAQMAEFKRVKFEKNGVVVDDPASKTQVNPLARKFRSHTWEIELEVVDLPVDANDLPLDPKDVKGGRTKKFLTGRLINITDRLQLMGVGNTMVLNVWLDTGKGARPFPFRIGGEFIPGMGITRTIKVKGKDGQEVEQTVPANVLSIVPTRDHILSTGTMNVAEIAKVEQVFDSRTVPVRRIEAMALGKTDSRWAGLGPLKPPKFYEPKEGEGAGTGTGTGMDAGSTGMPPGGIGSAGGTPGGMGGMPMGISGGGDATGGTTTPTNAGFRAGGGALDVVINKNKQRYVEVTDSVRRMPVGIVVVVDQSQMQDVLLAFANSPLRFQITQVTWGRFRGGLGSGYTPPAGGMGTGTGEDAIVSSGPGNTGDEFRPSYTGSGGMSAPPMPGMGMPMPGAGGYNPYNPYGGTGMGSGNLSTVSESQLTAGLIELSIYGVVSLYEKYVSPEEIEAEKKAKEAKDAKDAEAKEKDTKQKDAKEKDPMPADPKETDPMPKDAKGTDPKAAKMRRRVR